MPQVDAVAAFAEPARNRVGERASEGACRVRDRRQQQCGRHGEHEEAAAVDALVVVVHGDERVDHGGERDDAHRVEPAPGPRAVPGRHRRRLPGEGEQHADEQRSGARIGAVEDPRGVRTRPVQRPHQGRRADRAERDQGRQGGAAEQPHADQEERRPEQVELLLDRQRPQVAQQRRPAELGEIALVAEDETPVRDVEDRREGIAAQTDELSALERRADRQADREQREQGRQQSPRAPGPETAQGDPAAVLELGDQQ